MSTHKAAGKTKQHTRPAGKRLGLKVTHGQKVASGEVLIRQRGCKYKAGRGARLGRDFTLYSIVSGIVDFSKKLDKNIVSVKSN